MLKQEEAASQPKTSLVIQLNLIKWQVPTTSLTQNQQGAQGSSEVQDSGGSRRKMAVTGAAPDFGKKLHEAFQSTQTTKPKTFQGDTGYQAAYSSEMQQYDQQQQQQQQYYPQEEYYDPGQNYGAEMYGHQQGYSTESYHQQGYNQQYSQDGQYDYGQYGQDLNQGYSHGYTNEHQYPDPYYDHDSSMGYQQYGNEMESGYQQGHDWYGDNGNYYGGGGYYHWISRTHGIINLEQFTIDSNYFLLNFMKVFILQRGKHSSTCPAICTVIWALIQCWKAKGHMSVCHVKVTFSIREELT